MKTRELKREIVFRLYMLILKEIQERLSDKDNPTKTIIEGHFWDCDTTQLALALAEAKVISHNDFENLLMQILERFEQ